MVRPATELREICETFPTLFYEERGSSDFLHSGFCSQLQQVLRVLPGISCSENGIAGDQYFYPRPNGFGHRVRPDAAVDLDAKIQTAFGTHPDQPAHLLE